MRFIFLVFLVFACSCENRIERVLSHGNTDFYLLIDYNKSEAEQLGFTVQSFMPGSSDQIHVHLHSSIAKEDLPKMVDDSPFVTETAAALQDGLNLIKIRGNPNSVWIRVCDLGRRQWHSDWISLSEIKVTSIGNCVMYFVQIPSKKQLDPS